MTNALIVDLAKSYRLHPSTVEFFVGPRLRQLSKRAESIADLRETVAPAIMKQILYNLSHVERGQRLVELATSRLIERSAMSPPSVLDIGSGIGGTLIAFGRAGFKLTGIELSEARQEMCRRNLHENGLVAALESADLCERGLDGRKFQVVVCNSVIEHVSNPASMIRRFEELVAPGGVLLMGVANCEALGNAISDPHYGMFGLTFTPPGLAASLYDALVVQRQFYSVTEWHTIDRYSSSIEAAIGPVERIPPSDDVRGMEAVPKLLARFTAAFEATYSNPRFIKRPDLMRPLEAAVAAYLGRVTDAYRIVAEGWPEQRFLETFMRKSFQLVAVRRRND